MRFLFFLSVASFIFGCSTNQPLDNRRVRDAYLAHITRCVAENHTLLNRDEVEGFLMGEGNSNIQVLKFISNRTLESVGLNVYLGRIQAGIDATFEGDEIIKTVELRRKPVYKDTLLFKLRGMSWITEWMNDCEKLRGKWVEVDENLNYTYHSTD
ncbi:hypothetical protein QUF72_20225 [Desulfobacterales bacterium HSG2]|nr:hypothetical protein [Desulfobacterales bacterium HSG2]